MLSHSYEGRGKSRGWWRRDSTPPSTVHAGWDVAHYLSQPLCHSSWNSILPPHVALSPTPCQPHGLSPKSKADPGDLLPLHFQAAPPPTWLCLRQACVTCWLQGVWHRSHTNDSTAPYFFLQSSVWEAIKPHYFCSEEWAVTKAAIKGILRALFNAEWHQQAHGKY